jgi:hypothetical protein
MSITRDWLPTTREGQLEMCRDWMTVAGLNESAWGIPPAVMQVTTLYDEAVAALEVAKTETTRTPAKKLCLLAWSLAA